MNYRIIATAIAIAGLLLPALPADAARRIRTKATQFQGLTYSGTLAQDIVDLRDVGANLVNYQLILGEDADNLDLATYNARIEQKLVDLDIILAKSEELGMKVLVNVHTPPGGFESRTAPSQHRIFSDKALQDGLVALWGRIALRYLGRSGIYAYDVLNEPAQRSVAAGVGSWNELAKRLVDEIRKVDSTTLILIMPIYGNPDNFKKLAPIAGANIGYNFHQYFTSAFRSQGLNGRPVKVAYPKGKFNKKALEKSVKKALNFQKRSKQRMVCGEFAAPRWAFKNSAVRYLRDNIKIFRKYGWDWANHAWREADVWSMEHTNDINNSSKSATPTDRQKMFEKFFSLNN